MAGRIPHNQIIELNDKIKMDIINLRNFKENDLIVIRILEPPITEKEEKTIKEWYEEGVFGEGKVIVIDGERLVITRENIDKLKVVESDSDDN